MNGICDTVMSVPASAVDYKISRKVQHTALNCPNLITAALQREEICSAIAMKPYLKEGRAARIMANSGRSLTDIIDLLCGRQTTDCVPVAVDKKTTEKSGEAAGRL